MTNIDVYNCGEFKAARLPLTQASVLAEVEDRGYKVVTITMIDRMTDRDVMPTAEELESDINTFCKAAYGFELNQRDGYVVVLKHTCGTIRENRAKSREKSIAEIRAVKKMMGKFRSYICGIDNIERPLDFPVYTEFMYGY